MPPKRRQGRWVRVSVAYDTTDAFYINLDTCQTITFTGMGVVMIDHHPISMTQSLEAEFALLGIETPTDYLILEE
jgi:hypothetical protein